VWAEAGAIIPPFPGSFAPLPAGGARTPKAVSNGTTARERDSAKVDHASNVEQMASRTAAPPGVDVSAEINATPRVVVDAFFDPAALTTWWGALRSVTTPRAMGVYAIEWPSSTFRDDVLGRLGGVFRGTVMHFEGTRGFFIADAYWLPPDAGPIGPMALEMACSLGLTTEGRPTAKIRITQTGFEESARWRRYYEVLQAEWPQALGALKAMLEKR
jgi:hypothetical protein